MRLEDLILEVKYGVLLDEGPVDLPLYDGGEAGVVISVILVGIKRLQAQFCIKSVGDSSSTVHFLVLQL